MAGIVLTLRLSKAPRKDKSGSLRAEKSIFVGGKSEYGCHSSGFLRDFARADGDGYRGFGEAVQGALDSAPQKRLLILFSSAVSD